MKNFIFCAVYIFQCSCTTKGYSRTPTSSKMERLAAIVNGFHSLSILANLFILGVCEDRGYVSGIYSVENAKDHYFHFQTLNKFSLRKFQVFTQKLDFINFGKYFQGQLYGRDTKSFKKLFSHNLNGYLLGKVCKFIEKTVALVGILRKVPVMWPSNGVC